MRLLLDFGAVREGCRKEVELEEFEEFVRENKWEETLGWERIYNRGGNIDKCMLRC